MHTITLQDGTVVDKLTLNGNNYISDTLIADAVFTDNLATVEINDGKNTQTYKDMKLIANQTHDGKSWIILAEKTDEDKLRDRITEVEKATGSGGKAGEKGIAIRIDSLENRIAKLEGF